MPSVDIGYSHRCHWLRNLVYQDCWSERLPGRTSSLSGPAFAPRGAFPPAPDVERIANSGSQGRVGIKDKKPHTRLSDSFYPKRHGHHMDMGHLITSLLPGQQPLCMV